MTFRATAVWLCFCVAVFFPLAAGAFAANDPLFALQWGLHRVQAERAWGPAASGSGVVVAVVDTGVDFGHPDLAGRSAGALNSIKSPDTPCASGVADNNGHGTQVAGIISANSNNGHGIASVAPGAMILSVKALDCRGSGYLSDVSKGIRLAVEHRARVINLSLGYEIGILGALLGGIFGEAEVRDFQSAINEAANEGAVVIAAAGNDSLQSSYSGMDNVMVVGASGPADEQPTYSSSGAEIVAPGGNSTGSCGGSMDRCIATTQRGGGYFAVKGTSFAAPHVSGLAALLFRQGHSAPAVRSIVRVTADAVPAGPRINAARAVGAPPSPEQGEDRGVKAQGPAEGAVVPAGSGAEGPAGGKATDPAAAPGGPAGSATAAADSGQAPGILVLGAAQNPPPEISPSIAGYAQGAGAGGRGARPSPKKTAVVDMDPPEKWMAFAAAAVAAGGGAFLWKRRRAA